MKPPKAQIFYDTSICVAAAREQITQEEWRTVARFVSRSFRYRISDVTVHELLRGIDRGGPELFLKTKKGLAFVYPAHQKEFLPPPGNFVTEKLFGNRVVPWINSVRMHQLVKAFLGTAKSDTLYSRQIWKGKDISPVANLVGHNLTYIHNANEAAFRWETDRLSRGRRPFSPDDWIVRQLKNYGQPNTPENRSKVAEGLSAACHFEKFLWHVQKDLLYDFLKHSSDREDFSQLHYLADPSMYFVTGDTKLQKRIAASPQATRVLQWRDLYKMAKDEKKLALARGPLSRLTISLNDSIGVGSMALGR